MRIILIFIYITSVSTAAFSQTKNRVLLLSSYNSSFPTFFQQINGIRSVLDSSNTILDVEFLDSKRFIDSTYKALYGNILRYKLSKLPKYDAIMSADDNALQFILRYQNELFLNTPIVFFGVNNIELALAQNSNPNVTGIVEAVSMKETVDLMLRCFPTNKEIYAIVDNTESGQADLVSYKKLQRDYPDFAFKIIDLHEMSFAQYETVLCEIDINSPVLLLSAYNDITQTTIEFDESLALIRSNLSAPLFHLWYHGMGEGILGGKLISQWKQGSRAAKITQAILMGTDISKIAVITESPNEYVFDYNVLQKFGIKTQNLPQDKVLINLPQSFYTDNKGLLITVLLIFVFLLLFIVILMLNIISRRKIAIELSVQNQVYATLNHEYITQNKELRTAKEKAEESDRLKSEFIHNMSHEVRTPLNGILGFSGFLSEPDLTHEQQKGYITIIQNSGNQLLRIIDDILEISILGTKQVEVFPHQFSLNELLTELHSTFKPCAEHKNIPLYLKNELSHAESIIICDEGRLSKILSNLIENAIKFTHEGYIEFGSRLINKANQLWIQVYVKDTGIGIRKENHQSIFERFSQEEKEITENVGGLGLGLSIAKESAEVLGGTITVISEKGEGATFFVNLPYTPCTEPVTFRADTTRTELPLPNDYTFIILIAEDVTINQQYLEELLKKKMLLKCTILSARTGEETVAICHSGKQIDLVLLDLKMPIMDGFEAARQIKKLRPNLTIVAQTTYSSEQDKENALKAGCNEFISKPIEANELSTIIRKYLLKRLPNSTK